MVRMVAVYPLKIAALAVPFWLLVRSALPQSGSVIAAGLLAMVFHVAIAALLTRRRRLRDARLLEVGLRGEPPRDGQRVAVAGMIEAERNLLQTPFSDVPCVLYSYEIYRMVTPPAVHLRTRTNTTSTSKKVTDFAGGAMSPAVIRTENARFALGGFPHLTGPVQESGADADRKAAARRYIRRTTFVRTVPMLGRLAALEKAMVTVARSIRFDCQMTDGEKINDATIHEEYVRDGTAMCAFGIYSTAHDGLIPGRGAEQRIHLIAGDPAEVIRGLVGGARYSLVLSAVMLLIVVGVLAYILSGP